MPYWDFPEYLAEGRFLRVGAGDSLLFAVWQELDRSEDGGDNYLSMAVSADGRRWRRFERFAGPFPFVGGEAPIFSIAVTPDDVCYIVISESKEKMLVYRTDAVERRIELVQSFPTPSTTVSPQLFLGADGGLRLFVIRDARNVAAEEGFENASASSIFYSRSDDGVDWSDFSMLLGSDGADATIQTQFQFLPYHTAAFGREYVVYQVYYTDENNNLSNQLYLKVSEDNGVSWSDSDLVTDFRDPAYSFGQIDNQRAQLYALDDVIGMVWERGLTSSNPNIYYVEISPEGVVKGAPEQITRRSKDHRAPQLIRFDGRTYVLWFDNHVGQDHVMLARRQGIIWVEEDLTAEVPGRSNFGRIVVFEKNPYVFFTNFSGGRHSVVYLGPDESVGPPKVTPADFVDGNRYRRDRFSIRWEEPKDSSGISGYAIVADRDPDGRPPADATIPGAQLSTTLTVEEDGLWFFHLAARDAAGNWSDPSTVSVFRDTTPPQPVTFIEPETDEAGYLVSNTQTLRWKPPADDDVAGYSYSFQYLYTLGRSAVIRNVSLRSPSGTVLTADPRFSFRNIDNGLWALSVAPIDTVGNRGAEQVLFVLANKYIPVTYITAVTARQDDLGRLDVTITGRGFSADGLVSKLLFDRNGAPPFDYEYSLQAGVYEVATDRVILGRGIEGVDEGKYLVGVVHPVRGVHFSGSSIAVAPSGQVKFGDFRSYRPPTLFVLRDGKYAVPLNLAIFLFIIALFAFLILFSSQRIVTVARENRVLRMEVRALLTGELTDAERKERMKAMKRRGVGLRVKFALFTILLVISIVLIVAFPLGITMTGTQERILAQGLKEQTDVLLESLRAGAENYLPDAVKPDSIEARLQLSRLPRQRSGVDASRFVIITGGAEKVVTEEGAIFQPEGTNYVWAHDDPDISEKIDTVEFIRGASRIEDPISKLVPAIASEIDQRARALVGDLPAQLQQLVDERSVIFDKIDNDIVNVTEKDYARFSELGTEIPKLQQQLLTKLEELNTGSYVYPEYDPERLSRENTDYVFFKPIVYAITGEDLYFRGLVRVGITTEPIIRQINAERTRIVITTGVISLIAIGIGVIGALILSSIIIIPIRRLVQGVEVIRDTEDKEELKSHVINVHTRDEIATLAETVNQMTRGLAEAAAANKDLILGKDTQKMFVPLEQDPQTGRKLTTAQDVNEYVEFFGYYEGAKGVSGDYFDFARLDSKHYAIIKCDVAGKGVPASLIMVEVATIFLDYFRNWSIKTEGIHLDRLAYRINDLVEQRGFKGRFAALMICILNIESGQIYYCNAGDKYIHVYDAAAGRTVQRELPEAPAAGVFPSDLVEMGSGFRQIASVLQPGDSLLLFTDGVEEDKRTFRDAEYRPIVCAEPGLEEGRPHDTHVVGEKSEEFGIPRIHRIIDAVYSRGSFQLHKYHTPTPDEQFLFDFGGCEGTVEEVVLALAAVDKVFRVYRSPSTDRNDRVRVDVKIDEFLKRHFVQYTTYFRDPVHDEHFPEYLYFPFLREDDQYDDLTILGVRKY